MSTTLPASRGSAGAFGRQKLAPWLFVSPYLLLTAVFFLYPVAYATLLAFYQTNGPASRAYVGLENFTFILADRDFHTAVINTVVFCFFSLAVQLPLSLGLALLLNTKGDPTKAFFRLALFAPNLVGQVFVGILFAVLFTPRFGLFNQLVHAVFGIGLEARWLADPSLVMPAIVLASLWIYVGFNMVYFLAALQNVDQSLVEAARIDGAGPFSVFWHVTLPAIKPVATFVIVMSTIGSFNLFELPFSLLRGYGPNNSGLTIVGYLYRNAFEQGDLGMGAAIGWTLTAMILALSLIQIKLSGANRRDA
jgi:ABC-type sugar transport system permease subunit